VSKRIHSFIAAGLLALVSAGCAGPAPSYDPPEIRQGVIEQITPVNLPSNHHQGLGAVLGGAAGLGLGSLIGAGTGRDVAMVAGAIGGAIVGNEVQKNHAQPVPGQQIIVRTRSGVLVAVTQPVGPYLQVGQRVYLQGSGENTRVIPQ
jgi:outer membrane lipoprotein SlyB